MFFNSETEIKKIATRVGASVFVVPDEVDFTIKNATVLTPEEKSVITIEQARGVISTLGVKQISARYIVIRPAELLSEEAANALLKNLEEPKDNVHFILVTSAPSRLLPTILSRTAIYFLRQIQPVDGEIRAEAKIKDLAKRMIVARPADYVNLAEEISKKKDGVRSYALEVLAVTIEMLYKSYFKTKKQAFINKLPKFLAAYENIEKNGNVKLHLVADLI